MFQVKKPSAYRYRQHIYHVSIVCCLCGEVVPWLDYYYRSGSGRYSLHVECFVECLRNDHEINYAEAFDFAIMEVMREQ